MKNTALIMLCTGMGWVGFTGGVFAQTPQFEFPVACELDKDCWLISYVDTNPDPDIAQDFTCGHKTTEGHKGTDIALRSRIEMNAGVDVVAARDGKVLRMRDGQDDTQKTEDQYAAIRDANKDCGNGVILDHGNGVQTYYCHLKQGSITVAPEQRVQAGDKIAQIGQSGLSEFPHLHFTVIWEGGHIDPFTGQLMDNGCGQYQDNMWVDDLTYAPYSVFDGGFRDAVPDFANIKIGEQNPTTLPVSAPALVYWAGFYHAREGDQLTLTIRDPDGEIFAQRIQDITRARKRPSYYYTGRKITDTPLKSGVYRGETTYTKKGYPPKTIMHEITVR